MPIGHPRKKKGPFESERPKSREETPKGGLQEPRASSLLSHCKN
jgi:hypothetical protein